MVSRHTPTLAVAAILGVLAGPAARGEETRARTAVPREEIETLEARLDRAVDRVSLPHATRFVGRAETARGYRLPGYGLVFVLTPRALPAANKGVFVFRTGHPRHRVVRVETPADVSTSASRGQAPADVSTSASRGQARREPEPPAATPRAEEQEIETFERQVLTLQAETEEARRAAEEEMERLVHDVRILRLAPSLLETPPPAPEAPRAPSPEAPAAAPAVPPLPEAPITPSTPEPPLPPPPPWKFWFEAGAPQDDRTPEALVADVRAAVIDALGMPGGTLPGLGGDEFVTVAVDFVPGGFFAAHARPDHTLVVRARVKDIEARGRGAITPEELRQRVLVAEY